MGTGIVEAILAIWAAISTWIVNQLALVQDVFWVVNSDGVGNLTFMGVLSVATLGIGFVFLLIGVIQNFIKFRS